MTDDELKGIAAQSLNLAKRDLERNQFNFLLAAYHAGDVPPLFRMRKVEALIIEKLGADWLNHGPAKDAGFGVLRLVTGMRPPGAVAFVTACNRFMGTERFQKLSPAEQEKIVRSGHDGHRRAVRDGLLSLVDSLVATVQTAERVCVYSQAVSDGGLTGAPEVHLFDQSDFDGRMKLYGGGVPK